LFYDQMTARFALQNFEESRIDRSLNDDPRSIRIEKVDAYSTNIDFSKATSSKNTVYYGVEYVLNDVTSIGRDEDISTGEINPGSTRYPQSSWQSIAAYVNDELKLSDKFTLQTGIRYNQFILNADFDTTFYPFPFTKANINNGALTGS